MANALTVMPPAAPQPLAAVANAMPMGQMPAATVDQSQGFKPDLGKYRRWFNAYEANKTREIEEQIESKRYYHDKQWTEAQKLMLERRGQAPIWDNRIKRKIDFLVGVEQRMRRDPKAFARKPGAEQDEQADVATAAMRYACDANRWETTASDCANDGMIEGIGVAFVGIKSGQSGLDPELKYVPRDRFFYDPRSIRPDFKDARYMGLHLWMDVDEAKEKWPGLADDLDDLIDKANTISALVRTDQQHAEAWADFENRRVRVVEFWEKTAKGWYYCNFTGDTELDAGVSPYVDELGQPDCPYEAWSPYIDDRGDRYGPVRSMRPLQDEINHRRSKLLHLFSTNKYYAKKGVIDDVDEFKKEMSRPDGFIEGNGDYGTDIVMIDVSKDIKGQADLLEQSQSSLENLGPNPGLIGQGGEVAQQSGRAILAQRDSGMTELSPVFERNRDWKLRVYRKVWNRIKQAWTGEKWIRITNDPNSPNIAGVSHIPLNQFGIHPETGQMMAQNVVAMIDVDIIMEEGPDVITMNEELLQTLSQLGPGAVPPKVLIELSNTPNKKELFDLLDQASAPNPAVAQMQQQMARLEQLLTASETDKNVAIGEFNRAQALAALMKAATPEAPKPAGKDAMGNPLPAAPPQQPNLALVAALLKGFPLQYGQPTLEEIAMQQPPPDAGPPGSPGAAPQAQPGPPPGSMPPPSGAPMPGNPMMPG